MLCIPPILHILQRWLPLWMLGTLLIPSSIGDAEEIEPIVGIRDTAPQVYALENATIIVRSGESIEAATLVVREEKIEAVGKNIDIPAGAQRLDLTGKHIYPGFVDLAGEADVPLPKSQTGYWNDHVTPQRSVADVLDKQIANAGSYREQGITVRLIAPRGGIIKGTSSLVLVLDSDGADCLLAADVAQHMQLTVPRNGPGESDYPNSPMGAVALLRQALLDADWHRSASRAHRNAPEIERPAPNDALTALGHWAREGRVVIDAPNERMAVRARKIADEFSLRAILQGSGREYRRLDVIVDLRTPILLPVDFPEAPDVADPNVASDVTLQRLMDWHFAAQNPRMLHERGVELSLTSAGLDDGKDFLKKIRRAVAQQLPADAALAAMTIIPAKLLEVDDQIGSLERGKLANLVVTDGDLFADETKVLETWVAGQRHKIEAEHDEPADPLLGTWAVVAAGRARPQDQLMLRIDRKKKKLTGSITRGVPEEKAEEDAEAKQVENSDDAQEQPPKVKLDKIVRAPGRLTATVPLHELSDRFEKGLWRIVIRDLHASESSGPQLYGEFLGPDGAAVPIQISAHEPEQDQKDEDDGEDERSDEDISDGRKAADAPQPALADIEINHPLGAYGRTATPDARENVLLRDATVWTCGPQGVLQNGDILIQGGKIAAVGVDLKAPADCQIVQLAGRHVTPGLIDCHSHMATDGGVNESAQAVTAEVRIGDFIDNSDITIYRQLAGGLTTANILHGSANPIGGQNAVIKLRWGATMDEMLLHDAPAGVKFALGENVKRSNRGGRQTRYPGSRMGVERIIRDQLAAAREYDRTWSRWNAGDRSMLPPRRDLQLEALAEVVRGERWIHCHSYRQDEIVALLDVLDEFGIQIGTLQHILEGYKVADRMREHGAMGSSFADWWAYKFEVYDAIPHNGALMHDSGVVVSFNSDDAELGRHLNTEAAKAVRFGGVPEQEALKFVTLNPARQLRIDHRVGSIEVGKDADLAVWSGRPLSTTSACLQTWIDGRRYFDREEDSVVRERDQQTRQRLIQAILASGEAERNGGDEHVEEEDRWDRYDAFCGHDHAGHDDHDASHEEQTNHGDRELHE